MTLNKDKKLEDSKLDAVSGGTGETDSYFATLPEGYSIVYYVEGKTTKHYVQIADFYGDNEAGCQVRLRMKMDEMYANHTLDNEFINKDQLAVEFQFVEKTNGAVKVYFTFNMMTSYGCKW